MKEEPTSFYPSSPEDWRAWLQENHDKEQSVWVVYYKAKSGVPSITWSQAVDEALCFGWIDSTRKSFDDDRFTQYFCRRKPTSMWSKINKEKVRQLIADGKMEKAGLKSIEIAKQNGSWTMLDEVEEDAIPDDLQKEFLLHEGAEEFFLGLSKSVRKMMLQWIVLAKRPETRQKRISEIASLAGQKMKPKQF